MRRLVNGKKKNGDIVDEVLFIFILAALGPLHTMGPVALQSGSALAPLMVLVYSCYRDGHTPGTVPSHPISPQHFRFAVLSPYSGKVMSYSSGFACTYSINN